MGVHLALAACCRHIFLLYLAEIFVLLFVGGGVGLVALVAEAVLVNRHS